MSVLKVVELLSSSTESWEDAAKKAVAKASETLGEYELPSTTFKLRSDALKLTLGLAPHAVSILPGERS